MTGDPLEDIDYEVVEGRIENGEVIAETIELMGFELELKKAVPEDEISSVILKSMAGSIQGYRNEPLLSTDLTEYETKMKDDTATLEALQFVARHFPVTTNDVESALDEAAKNSISWLCESGKIAKLSKDGHSYKYVPTHVGLAELQSRDMLEQEESNLFEGDFP